MKKVLPPDTVKKVISLYKEMSIDKISREVGVNRHVINRVLKENGVVLRKPTDRSVTFPKKV